MAKQSMIQRERKRERLIAKHQVKRESLKEDLKSANNFQERLALYKKFERIPRNSSPSRNRNRCWVTGRSRGFYRDFGFQFCYQTFSFPLRYACKRLPYFCETRSKIIAIATIASPFINPSAKY